MVGRALLAQTSAGASLAAGRDLLAGGAGLLRGEVVAAAAREAVEGTNALLAVGNGISA